jgi:formylmethanofuran dehydrogenase subunit E
MEEKENSTDNLEDKVECAMCGDMVTEGVATGGQLLCLRCYFLMIYESGQKVEKESEA